MVVRQDRSLVLLFDCLWYLLQEEEYDSEVKETGAWATGNVRIYNKMLLKYCSCTCDIV